jgi:hypothetical protein
MTVEKTACLGGLFVCAALLTLHACWSLLRPRGILPCDQGDAASLTLVNENKEYS